VLLDHTSGAIVRHKQFIDLPTIQSGFRGLLRVRYRGLHMENFEVRAETRIRNDLAKLCVSAPESSAPLQEARVVLLSAEPGIGKSRLTAAQAVEPE